MSSTRKDSGLIIGWKCVGRVGPTGPRKARPDDRLRRNPPPFLLFVVNSGLRGVYHRARIRATRWLIRPARCDIFAAPVHRLEQLERRQHHERDLFGVVRQDGKIAKGRAWFEEN